jgi:rhodanese-related sulfurtransferase
MTATDRIAQVDPTETARLIADGALLLDVRELDEWAAGHAPGAVHVPLGQLDPATLPRDRVVVAICRSGNRSGTAARWLAAAGIDVRNLAGGMKAWAADGHPVRRDDGQPGTVA